MEGKTTSKILSFDPEIIMINAAVARFPPVGLHNLGWQTGPMCHCQGSRFLCVVLERDKSSEKFPNALPRYIAPQCLSNGREIGKYGNSNFI